MNSFSTLLFLLMLFMNPLFSQGSWWDDLDLPTDTIYVSDCQDVDLMKTNTPFNPLIKNWIFPSDLGYPDIIGSYRLERNYDEDSICIGGIIKVTLLNWLNFETFNYERIISLNPDLSGPCGQFFSFEKEKVEEGLLISDLDSNSTDISFFDYGTGDTLFLPIPPYTKTYPVAIIQNPGLSLCFVSIEVQVNGWYGAELLTDTVYISDCADMELLQQQPVNGQIFKEWVCVNCHELMDIVGTYYIEKIYDTDSQCIGGIMNVTLLNWSNLVTYEYERVIVIKPDLQGPCGEYFLFEYEEIEEGIQFIDLNVQNDDLSFFPDGSEDPLVLNLTESGIYDIPVFQTPGQSVCFFKMEVDVKPACLDTFLLEVNDGFVMTVGADYCNKITLKDLQIQAEYYCTEFEVGFLNSDNLLSDQIEIKLDLDQPNRMEELTIAMKTWDNEEFSITFDIQIIIDPTHLNSVFMFTDDPYMLEGDVTYIGVGANLRNTPAIQGEILFTGAKVLDVEIQHPYLKPENYNFNNDQGFFRFSFNDPWNVLTFEDGTPWFVLQVQAEEEGHLSDLLDLSDPNNFNLLWVETDMCPSGLPFSFTFNFSQELIFSSNTDLTDNHPIQLFPNPTTDKIYIDFERDIVHGIKVFDMRGRLVLSKEKINNYLDVSQLNSGLYKLIIHTDKGTFSGEFIKQ